MVKCPRCGYENPPEAKYCLNCGYKLIKEEAPKLEAEGLLLISAGIIMLISAFFNSILRIIAVLLLLYLIFGILAIYSGYKLYKGSVGLYSLLLSSLVIVFGFGLTMFLFLLGASLKGLVSPDWILFVVAGAKLFSDRKVFKKSAQ